MLEVNSLSIFSTAKEFKRSLFMTDLRYIFNLLRVEKDLSEEQFVAGVHRNIVQCPHKDRLFVNLWIVSVYLGPEYFLELLL